MYRFGSRSVAIKGTSTTEPAGIVWPVLILKGFCTYRVYLAVLDRVSTVYNRVVQVSARSGNGRLTETQGVHSLGFFYGAVQKLHLCKCLGRREAIVFFQNGLYLCPDIVNHGAAMEKEIV